MVSRPVDKTRKGKEGRGSWERLRGKEKVARDSEQEDERVVEKEEAFRGERPA